MTVTSESLLCRGMRDLLPDDMAAFRRVEQAFREACAAWGYGEVRTPTLEHLYLFTSAGTLSPQLLGRVYSFLDWDGWTGERVVLRPDATIPVARLFRERLEQPLAKLAYVANIFRFGTGDEPREVWQCGAELIGDSWPAGDVELITMARQVVESLGRRDVRVRLSHTGVVRALLQHAGFAQDEQAELYDRLLDGDHNVLADIEARVPELGPALSMLTGIQVGGSAWLANLRSAFLPAVPGMAAPLDELELIVRAAVATGTNVEVSVAEVRDFEYYTGPVFQLLAGDTTVAAGGRYDRLIMDSKGGSLPACGFALYLDQLLPLVESGAPLGPELVAVEAAEHSSATLALAVEAVRRLQAEGLSAGLVVPGNDHRRRLLVATQGDTPAYVFDDTRTGRQQSAESIEALLSAIRRA